MSNGITALDAIGGGNVGIRIVIRSHRNDNVDNLCQNQQQQLISRAARTHNQQRTFEVIRFAITKEVANYHDGKDKQDDHEDLKVEIHIFAHDPAHDDDKRGVEQRRLNRGTNAVKKSKVLQCRLVKIQRI